MIQPPITSGFWNSPLSAQGHKRATRARKQRNQKTKEKTRREHQHEHHQKEVMLHGTRIFCAAAAAACCAWMGKSDRDRREKEQKGTRSKCGLECLEERKGGLFRLPSFLHPAFPIGYRNNLVQTVLYTPGHHRQCSVSAPPNDELPTSSPSPLFRREHGAAVAERLSGGTSRILRSSTSQFYHLSFPGGVEFARRRAKRCTLCLPWPLPYRIP